MSKTTHTPGPWRVSFEGGTTQIRAANNESLMCDETYYPWVPENYADWYLIAAAPDLLKALEYARDTILELINRRGSECEGRDEDWVADIDAAITKAKGGAE